MTPSVKLSSRSVFMAGAPTPAFIQPQNAASGKLAVPGLRVGIDLRLLLDPLDQFVELDGLLGCSEGVGGRKSSFAGGLSRAAGGFG